MISAFHFLKKIFCFDQIYKIKKNKIKKQCLWGCASEIIYGHFEIKTSVINISNWFVDLISNFNVNYFEGCVYDVPNVCIF